jgi:uncharacterized membrane protein
VHPTGIAHTSVAVISLLLGAVMLRMPKGTELHRVLGILYVFSMIVLNVTALTIYRLFGGFGVFHVLALVNLAALLLGFGAVFLKRPRGAWLVYHYYFMGWSYVGLCAAAGSEIGVRLPGVSLLLGTLVPTSIVTLVGGAWVEMSRRSTLQALAGRHGSG